MVKRRVHYILPYFLFTTLCSGLNLLLTSLFSSFLFVLRLPFYIYTFFFNNFIFYFYNLTKNIGTKHTCFKINKILFMFHNCFLAVTSICPTTFRPIWQISIRKFSISPRSCPKDTVFNGS